MNEYFSFSEWYHYAILIVWLFILFLGVRYFSEIESLFNPKSGKQGLELYGKNLLIASFFLGIIMVLVWLFKPAEISSQVEKYWDYTKYAFYTFFAILLLFNAYVSFHNLDSKYGIIRIIVMSLLITIYFYSGMFGGLLIIAAIAIVLLIYVLVKFKNILKIK
jgi:hypothetical protein